MAETAESLELVGHRRRCEIEIVPPPGLRATLEASVHEGDPELPPTDIISTNQELIVKVKWCVLGDLRRHLCGTWCVCVSWESCGPALEGQWCQRLPFDPCLPDDKCYEAIFRFEPGRLSAGDCGTIYCLCVTLSSEADCPDGTRYPGLIFGFCKDVACVMVRPG
jgi:hypothetical protein